MGLSPLGQQRRLKDEERRRNDQQKDVGSSPAEGNQGSVVDNQPVSGLELDRRVGGGGDSPLAPVQHNPSADLVRENLEKLPDDDLLVLAKKHFKRIPRNASREKLIADLVLAGVSE